MTPIAAVASIAWMLVASVLVWGSIILMIRSEFERAKAAAAIACAASLLAIAIRMPMP